MVHFKRIKIESVIENPLFVALIDDRAALCVGNFVSNAQRIFASSIMSDVLEND